MCFIRWERFSVSKLQFIHWQGMWKCRSIWMRTDELTRNWWAGNWRSPSLGNDLLSLVHWKHFLLTDCLLSAASYPLRSSEVNTKGDFIRKPHFSYASRIEILSPCSFSELLSCPSRCYNLNVQPSSATWCNHDLNLELFKYITWGANSLVWAHLFSYPDWTSVHLETVHLDQKSQDSAHFGNLDFTMGSCCNLTWQS